MLYVMTLWLVTTSWLLPPHYQPDDCRLWFCLPVCTLAYLISLFIWYNVNEDSKNEDGQGWVKNNVSCIRYLHNNIWFHEETWIKHSNTIVNCLNCLMGYKLYKNGQMTLVIQVSECSVTQTKKRHRNGWLSHPAVIQMGTCFPAEIGPQTPSWIFKTKRKQF